MSKIFSSDYLYRIVPSDKKHNFSRFLKIRKRARDIANIIKMWAHVMNKHEYFVECIPLDGISGKRVFPVDVFLSQYEEYSRNKLSTKTLFCTIPDNFLKKCKLVLIVNGRPLNDRFYSIQSLVRILKVNHLLKGSWSVDCLINDYPNPNQKSKFYGTIYRSTETDKSLLDVLNTMKENLARVKKKMEESNV